MSKMYVCVRDDFPDFMTPTLVAHATLRHHRHWHELVLHKDEQYEDWLRNSFKKYVVRVNLKEFERIGKLGETHRMHITKSWENNTLNGEVSCITVIADDSNTPNVLKFAKLWKPLKSGDGATK